VGAVDRTLLAKSLALERSALCSGESERFTIAGKQSIVLLISAVSSVRELYLIRAKACRKTRDAGARQAI
jgi:hypothetical protein